MARSFQRGPRMAKSWDALGGAAVTAFTGVSTAIEAGTLARDEAWTVIRTIGEYLIVPGAAAQVNDHCRLGIGIGVFSTDAVVVGGTAVPDPLDDVGYPWLFWAAHRFIFGSSGVLEDFGGIGMATRRWIDIKSMRKIKPSETLAIVFQYESDLGDPPMDMSASFRVLVAR